MSEVINLPSNGCFGYDSEISIKEMRVGEEKLLSKINKVNFTRTMMDIFARLIDGKDIDFVKNMLISDGNYLYMKIREYTYTPKYEFSVKCSNCGEIIKNEIDIPDDLNITVAECDKIEGDGEITFTLPKSSDEITYRFIRYADQIKIENNIRRLKSSDSAIDYIFSIAYAIKTVNGNEMKITEKLKYVENLSSYDYSYLQEYVNSLTPGVDPFINVECGECGYEDRYLMPFNEHFFRPRVIRKS